MQVQTYKWLLSAHQAVKPKWYHNPAVAANGDEAGLVGNFCLAELRGENDRKKRVAAGRISKLFTCARAR